MARIFMDGFEMGVPQVTNAADGLSGLQGFKGSLWRIYAFGDSSWGNRTSDSLGVVTSPVANGGFSLRYRRHKSTTLGSGGGHFRASAYLGESNSKLFAKFNFRYDTMPQTHHIFSFRNGSAVRLELRLSAVGQLSFYADSVLVGTVDDAIPANTFTLTEVHVDIPNGIFQCKVDNILIFDYAGALGGSDLNYMYIGRQSNQSNTNSTSYFLHYYDDVCVNDGTGDVNNSWVGNTVIRLLKPKADGTNTDFTPETGEVNFSQVNTVPYTDNTTNVMSEQFLDKDSYIMQEVVEDLGISSSVRVNAILLQAVAKTEGSSGLASIIRIGSDEHEGDILPLTPDYDVGVGWVYNINPISGEPWELGDVDNTEAGFVNKEVT